jgi:hypothetical protein
MRADLISNAFKVVTERNVVYLMGHDPARGQPGHRDRAWRRGRAEGGAPVRGYLGRGAQDPDADAAQNGEPAKAGS